MKDGSAAVLPATTDPAPQRTGAWKFAVEIYPPEWKSPAEPFWIAGWILSDAGRGAADLRAWLGSQLFLGLCGLPRSEIETAHLGRVGPPHAGFSFLLRPDSLARDVRLEVCDEDGQWREFYHHALAPAAKGAAPSKRGILSDAEISRTLLRLLMARRAQPSASWRALADDALLSASAIPLDALPNPPFYGRLEFPQSVAKIKFGLLEISGWIAHRTERIKRLLAFIGPTPPVVLLHGRPRRDVTDAFGELRDGPNSQFVGYIEIPARLSQPPSLRIIAELENGQQHLAFNQRFWPQVTVESTSSLPSFSYGTFGCATGALWIAAKRRGVPLGPAWRPGIRTAWDVYRAEAPFATQASAPLSPLAPGTQARSIEVIVVTHNLNREGAPLIALEYAKHLAAQPGWKIQVVSAEDGPLAKNFLAAGLPVEIVDVSAIWRAKSPEDFARALQQIVSRCDWQSADLIVANTVVSFWAIHVARVLKKPSILYVHESASVRRFFATLAAPPIMPKIEQAFGEASRVAFSAAAAQDAHWRHRRRGNFCVAPGWINTAAIASYAATHSRTELRRAKAFADDAVIFANIGSVCERKGQHVFLHAIELLQRKRRAHGNRPNLSLIFLMVGATPGPFTDFLKNEISLRQLDGVQIVETVSDPYAYFQLADIFVCSSFEESLPRVVLEAAAFGLPVVSSAVNGVPEILGPEEAWLIPPGNAEQLADAMSAALESHLKGDRTRVDRAQHKVRAQFDAALLLPQHAALAAMVAMKSSC